MRQVDHTYIDDVHMFSNNMIHVNFRMHQLYFQLKSLPETTSATNYEKTILLAS